MIIDRTVGLFFKLAQIFFKEAPLGRFVLRVLNYDCGRFVICFVSVEIGGSHQNLFLSCQKRARQIDKRIHVSLILVRR